MGDLQESQKVLLPPKVYGFALRSRKLATFDIDLVKDVEYAHGWDNLVLNPTIKETVLALVKNHARVPERAYSVDSALSTVDLGESRLPNPAVTFPTQGVGYFS